MEDLDIITLKLALDFKRSIEEIDNMPSNHIFALYYYMHYNSLVDTKIKIDSIKKDNIKNNQK
jgi:hypothetical protein